jgi:hypothetical protein
VVQHNTLPYILKVAHNVVVAQDEFKRNILEVFDHFSKYFPFRIVVAVKKIA